MTIHPSSTSQSGPISPDCEVGKCPCTGDALDLVTDEVVDCTHGCHAATPSP